MDVATTSESRRWRWRSLVLSGVLGGLACLGALAVTVIIMFVPGGMMPPLGALEIALGPGWVVFPPGAVAGMLVYAGHAAWKPPRTARRAVLAMVSLALGLLLGVATASAGWLAMLGLVLSGGV